MIERYTWDQVPEEELTPLIKRQVIHTPSMTLLRVQFKRGAFVPAHAHVHQQISMVMSGRLRIEVEGVETVLTPGSVLVIPSNANHLAEALEDTVDIDIFSPARTDWLQ
jgi:quercetin dioxygenase-like cupin family protein